MRVTLRIDSETGERHLSFRGEGLHDNEHSQAVFDAEQAFADAIDRCQAAPHIDGYCLGKSA